jgi:hypothetical protein
MVGVANKQLEAIRSGDIKSAYSYTSSEFQKKIPLDKFEQLIGVYPALKQNKSASFTQRNIDYNSGEIAGSITTVNGETVPIEFNFIKENGEWKVTYITVFEKIENGSAD